MQSINQPITFFFCFTISHTFLLAEGSVHYGIADVQIATMRTWLHTSSGIGPSHPLSSSESTKLVSHVLLIFLSCLVSPAWIKCCLVNFSLSQTASFHSALGRSGSDKRRKISSISVDEDSTGDTSSVFSDQVSPQEQDTGEGAGSPDVVGLDDIDLSKNMPWIPVSCLLSFFICCVRIKRVNSYFLVANRNGSL